MSYWLTRLLMLSSSILFFIFIISDISSKSSSGNIKFINSFFKADTVFVTEIYAAGEKNIPNLNQKKIRDSMLKIGHKDVRLLNNFDKLADELLVLCKSGDFVVFLGAGSISSIAKKVTWQLKKII